MCVLYICVYCIYVCVLYMCVYCIYVCVLYTYVCVLYICVCTVHTYVCTVYMCVYCIRGCTVFGLQKFLCITESQNACVGHNKCMVIHMRTLEHTCTVIKGLLLFNSEGVYM